LESGKPKAESRKPEAPALLRGLDERKDQSYVLFGVQREYLSRMLLPVGTYRKPEIRRRAAELGLRVADKKDSQEICFVTSGHHGEFVRARRSGADTSGEIVTTDGRVVGIHDGIESFTIGQRKGLSVAMGEPYFVTRIEPDTRRVVIGSKEELGRRELTARDCNWLVDPPAEPFRCSAQIRYNSMAESATAEIHSDGRLRVIFDQPRYGVAPGQAVVCYDGPRVLGGGWIE
jgi:tRNA-specific 2-thiouridylase